MATGKSIWGQHLPPQHNRAHTQLHVHAHTQKHTHTTQCAQHPLSFLCDDSLSLHLPSASVFTAQVGLVAGRVWRTCRHTAASVVCCQSSQALSEHSNGAGGICHCRTLSFRVDKASDCICPGEKDVSFPIRWPPALL